MAEVEYSDPEAFRSSVNSCIQASRNITWLLQGQKASIPGFDAWYAGWQERFKDDAVMKWAVEARNQIVKKGDLATLSKARIIVRRGWDTSAEFECELPPMRSTHDLAMLALPSSPTWAQRHSIVGVERRWVATSLPDYELLDGLAHIIGELAGVVENGHLLVAGRPTGTAREARCERPACMVSRGPLRTAWALVDQGRLVELEETPYERDSAAMQAARERYGALQGAPADLMTRGLDELGQWLFSIARRLFEIDGYHVPTVIYVSGGGKMVVQSVPVESRGELMLTMEAVAANVGSQNAQRVFFIGEAWMTREDNSWTEPFAGVENAPNRYESLSLGAVDRDGEQACIVARIHRQDGKVWLGETETLDAVNLQIFNPVRRAWGKGGA